MFTENFLDYVDKASQEKEKDNLKKELTETQERLSKKIKKPIFEEKENTKKSKKNEEINSEKEDLDITIIPGKETNQEIEKEEELEIEISSEQQNIKPEEDVITIQEPKESEEIIQEPEEDISTLILDEPDKIPKYPVPETFKLNQLEESITVLTQAITALSKNNTQRIEINRDNTGKIINADIVKW